MFNPNIPGLFEGSFLRGGAGGSGQFDLRSYFKKN